MNDNLHTTAGRKIFIALIVIAAVIAVILAPKAAVNVDEQLHYPHAKKVVNWYLTGGEDTSSLNTPVTNLKYYGQSVDNFTALVNRVFDVQDEFRVRHYTGAFFFIMMLIITGLLAREVSGSWLLASGTVIALICMPRLSGQAFGNLKDIPFAVGYTAGVLFILRSLKAFPYIRWKTIILLGLTIAFTVSVRAGGFILFAYLGLVYLSYFVLKPALFLSFLKRQDIFQRLVLQGITVISLGYFAGLIFWPYALQKIFVHPFESLQVMEHYKVSIRQVFNGKLMWSTDLPWYYLPKWMLISTPLILLTGFLIYSVDFIRRFLIHLQINKQTLSEAFVIFTFIFPFVYVIVIDSNLYSGIRQMLFIFPIFSMMAVWGTYKLVIPFLKVSKKVYYTVIILILVILVWPISHSFKTFPADYIYFNAIAGGNPKAWGNYEYDYYYHSIKEAVDYLTTYIEDDEEVIVAMNNNLSNYFDHSDNITYQYTRYPERSSFDWDYGIFGLNYLEPDFLKRGLWNDADVIKTIYHLGNPVAIILERVDKSDFYGISEIKNGNLQSGIEHLESSLAKQKYNVWLHVNLARAYYDIGSRENFLFHIGKGKEILPDYEPLLLLEAETYYKESDYDKAEYMLGRLLEVNPRYLPAKWLLEKLGEH